MNTTHAVRFPKLVHETNYDQSGRERNGKAPAKEDEGLGEKQLT